MILKIFKNKKRVLGLNERNIGYIRKYNSLPARQIADNKALTKKVLNEHDIETTRTLLMINNFRKLKELNIDELPKSFVVKPDRGIAGQGIEIIYNRDKKGNFVKTNSQKLSPSALSAFISSILEGEFSLTYTPDKVLIEERVSPHKKFRPYIYKGTPDIRVVVFRRVPVMAMVRWPTKDSGGRANLAQGAVGTGIDLATGITTNSIKVSPEGKIYPIEYVEGKRTRYSGFKIPYWDKILRNAVAASRISKLGFCASDFLIDRNEGPLIVELNARPGLSIQLANNDGLRWRLEQVKHLRIKSDTHGIRIGKDLFGGEIEEEIEAIAGKKLISIIQPIKLYHPSGKKSTTIKAKVDTGAYYSSIDIKLAKELGFGDSIKLFENYNVPESMSTQKEAKEWKDKLHQELLNKDSNIINTHVISSSSGHSFRIALRLKCRIGEKIFTVETNVKDRSQLKFPMILGRKSMGDFLVDPTRRILRV